MIISSQKQQKRLRKLVIRQIRFYRRSRYQNLNLLWAKIRKQKDRRRRRTMAKLYKIERIKMMKQMAELNSTQLKEMLAA